MKWLFDQFYQTPWWTRRRCASFDYYRVDGGIYCEVTPCHLPGTVSCWVTGTDAYSQAEAMSGAYAAAEAEGYFDWPGLGILARSSGYASRNFWPKSNTILRLSSASACGLFQATMAACLLRQSGPRAPQSMHLTAKSSPTAAISTRPSSGRALQNGHDLGRLVTVPWPASGYGRAAGLDRARGLPGGR